MFPACLMLALLPAAWGCPICLTLPEESAADHLLAAKTVVLAREDPERPFHLAAIETLVGEPESGEIDLFLDSSTRRLLKTRPDRAVVLARVKEKSEWVWRRLGVSDSNFGPVVREIVAQRATWKKNPQARVAYFGERLAHPDRQVRELARLEIAAAPYKEIRKLGKVVPREELRRSLRNIRDAAWHPLYILLLAQSGDPEDRAYLLESFDAAARFGSSLRLAAWATAYVELRGRDGLAVIEERYGRNPGRSRSEIEAIVQALSVLGTGGSADMQGRIVAVYRSLLRSHPAMAPRIVGDLEAWGWLDDDFALLLAQPRQERSFEEELRRRGEPGR